MNAKGFALPAVLSLTFLLLFIGGFAVWITGESAGEKVAAARLREMETQAGGLLLSVAKALQEPGKVQQAARAPVAILWGSRIWRFRSPDQIPGTLVASLNLCGLAPNLEVFPGNLCGRWDVPPPPVSVRPVQVEALDGGNRYTVNLVLAVRQETNGREAHAYLPLTYRFFYPKAHPFALAVATNGLLRLGQESSLAGPGLAGGLTVAGRPRIGGFLAVEANGATFAGSFKTWDKLTPSPAYPCYAGACPAWGDPLALTGGNHAPPGGPIFTGTQLFEHPPSDAFWPRVKTGEDRRQVCYDTGDNGQECNEEVTPIYGDLPGNIQEVVLERDPTGSNRTRITFRVPRGTYYGDTLVYTYDGNQIAPVSAYDGTRAIPDGLDPSYRPNARPLVVGRDGRKILRVSAGGQVQVLNPIFIWTEGDLRVRGSFYPDQSPCALFSTPEGAEDVTCRRDTERILGFIAKGGTLYIENTTQPSTLFAFLSGRRVEALEPGGIVTVVGGVQALEEVSGTFRFYHNPNGLRVLGSSAFLTYAGHAALEIGAPTPYAP